MIATAELESAIRSAIPVSHLEIIDQSSGCGENYAILVVSDVSCFFFLCGRRGSLTSEATGVRGEDDLSETPLQ